MNDFVSYVDKGAEKLLVERLARALPEAGFITEEGTSTKVGARYCWVIDPLDGTTNFLHGVYPYAVSIGLMEYDDVIAGVVHEVGKNETFTACKGGGAWLERKSNPCFRRLASCPTVLLPQDYLIVISTDLIHIWRV